MPKTKIYFKKIFLKLFIILAVCGLGVFAFSAPVQAVVMSECSDGWDNDGDGKIDLGNDPGCLFDADNNEADASKLPVNLKASEKTKEFLLYFYSLPGRTGKKVISAQHFGRVPRQYEENVLALVEETGIWPGLLISDYYLQEQINTPARMEKIDYVNEKLLSHWNNGGLISMNGHMINPETLGPRNDMNINIDNIFNPSHQTYRNWIMYLDSIADGLQVLEDAGTVVIYRPIFEMNEGWTWWGGLSDREDYKKLWRQLYEYFTVTKGLDNLLWVWHPSPKAGNILEYYPGDDYVDILSISTFTCSPLTHTNLRNNYEILKTRGKPVVFGAGGITGWTNICDGTFDYNLWLRAIKEQYPDIGYFAAFAEEHAYISNRNATDFLSDPMIINRGEIEIMSTSLNNPSDVNSDGHVNIKDIQACIKVITRSNLTYEEQCSVLAPPDATTNIKDIQVIIREIINL